MKNQADMKSAQHMHRKSSFFLLNYNSGIQNVFFLIISNVPIFCSIIWKKIKSLINILLIWLSREVHYFCKYKMIIMITKITLSQYLLIRFWYKITSLEHFMNIILSIILLVCEISMLTTTPQWTPTFLESFTLVWKEIWGHAIWIEFTNSCQYGRYLRHWI